MLGRNKDLAPLNVQIKDNYYVIGDVYNMSLLVTSFPKNFEVGLLANYCNDPNVRVNAHTYSLNHNLSKDLNKEYKEKQDQWRKTTDPSEKERLRTDLEKLQNYIQEQVASNDKTINYICVFTLRADNLEDLKVFNRNFRERLRTNGFKVSTIGALKMGLMKAVNPLWLDHGIQKDVYYGLGVPMSTTSMAGLYPYIYSQLKDPNGFLLGYEYYNGGIIILDPMAYENDRAAAVKDKRLSGNTIVVGETGSGKTTDMSLIVFWVIRENMELIWIDPENKNEHITKLLGGTFIPWGTDKARINVFDLLKASYEEEEDSGIDPWNTEVAIFNAIDRFKAVLKLYKKDISEDTLSIVGELMIEMYAKKGITSDSAFRYLSKHEFPTLNDFNNLLDEKLSQFDDGDNDNEYRRLMIDLSIKIKPMLNEHKYFFDGFTTIDLDPNQKKFISFGTRLLNNKPLGLRDSLNYLMFEYAWSLCLDEQNQSAFVIDEAHELILDGVAAPQIASFFRRSRKYHNMMVVGTQEIRDFANEQIFVHGKAMFNNSHYKIIKGLSKDNVTILNQLMPINEQESLFIQRAGMGDALLVLGNKRIPIHVLATDTELSWIDPNRK